MVDTPMNNSALMRLLLALSESECEPATSAMIAQYSGVELRVVLEGLGALMDRGLVQPVNNALGNGSAALCYALTCKGREVAPIMLDALTRLGKACA
jgi:hypothetical protein